MASTFIETETGGMMQLDSTGRQIKPGDLLKVPHFTAKRGRKIFMYKLVVECSRDLRIRKSGGYWYAVDVADIWRQGSLDAAHKCPLSVIGDCEIIYGGAVEHDDLFWERPRHQKPLED